MDRSDLPLTVQPMAGIAKALAYKAPPPMAEKIDVGSLVRVPLGQRTELGIVTQLEVTDEYPLSLLKYIVEVVQPFPVLSPDLVRLGIWMAHYYACRVDTVFETMIPAAVRKGMKVKERRMLAIGVMPDAENFAKLDKRAPKQAKLLAFLKDQIHPVPRNRLLERLGVSPQSCTALVEKGYVVETYERQHRDAYADDLAAGEHVTDIGEITLNAEQAAAAAAFEVSLKERAFRTHLLHGVTGSGKTEVYIKAMQAALAQGGSVLFLVPEVALTPQTVGRLRSRIEASSGVKVVVWHSLLSDGERFDAWRAVASGESRVVVGARSGVFAPMRDLRLVIVDEEHEPAYKQDETPRYHGRDVAVYRAMLAKATCVLGSATPSLESLYNAKSDKYRLNVLSKRVDDRQLPLVHVVDMTRERPPEKGIALLSRLLVEKMRERFERREQTILFINRRGYAASLLCQHCGWLGECPHCSVTLTFHRTDDMLRCHLCGYGQRAPMACPKCSAADIRRRGYGTQRIEEAVGAVVPGAKIVRMDADTMRKKNLFREILADFRRGKIDILVGTQMIAKGLDFPNVTLVGLASADISLHIPDFRAAERTFQLMVQVSGRSGRGEAAGEVVVQTHMPHSAPIQYARRGDFDGFLDEELEERRQYHYPPYRHLIHHMFRGRNPEKVEFYAEQWAKRVEAALPKLEIRGPAPAPVEKIKDFYRYSLWFFVDNVTETVTKLVALRKEFPIDKDVIDVFDVDPVSIM